MELGLKITKTLQILRSAARFYPFEKYPKLVLRVFTQKFLRTCQNGLASIIVLEVDFTRSLKFHCGLGLLCGALVICVLSKCPSGANSLLENTGRRGTRSQSWRLGKNREYRIERANQNYFSYELGTYLI